MGKQATQERIRAGEDTVGFSEYSVVRIFEEHYRLGVKSMTPEAAAHTAYTAVVNHLASLKETQDAERGDPMR